MFERISRSIALVKASAEVLRQDKELLVFPLCSALAVVGVLASFAGPLIYSGIDPDTTQRKLNGASLVLWFLFYLTQYIVIFYFNSALVGAALIRLEGRDPTVADGFRIANAKLMSIVGYAAIAATVGLFLRIVEDRAGWLGRWIAGILGMAFSVASFLAVPLLVSRDIGPLDAIKQSAQLLEKTWGENITGNVGLGLVFFLIYIVVAAISVLLMIGLAATQSAMLVWLCLAAIVMVYLFLALVHSALHGIYSAALYRFAVVGDAGQSFNGTQLSLAFKPK